MKVNHGLIWSEEKEDKTIHFGFTKACIENKLQECFHVLLAETKEVREKGPLLVLETNDGVQSIKTPFAGVVSYFNTKARNFPDRLNEEEIIVTIVPKTASVKAKPVPKIVEVDTQALQDALNAQQALFQRQAIAAQQRPQAPRQQGAGVAGPQWNNAADWYVQPPRGTR